MTIDWNAYGNSLNIQPAGGSATCRWDYPPPCEGSVPSACAFYECDRNGGKYTGPPVTWHQLRAACRVAEANHIAKMGNAECAKVNLK